MEIAAGFALNVDFTDLKKQYGLDTFQLWFNIVTP